MRLLKLSRLAVLAFFLIAVASSASVAAQFCAGVGHVPTLSESIAGADAVVFAKWIQARDKSDENEASAEFEVVDVVRQLVDSSKDVLLDERTLEPAGLVKNGAVLNVNCNHVGEPGDLFLLTRRSNPDNDAVWVCHQKLTPAARLYINHLPSSDLPPAKRLAFFFEHLESADQTIAEDSMFEFERAPHADLLQFAEQLPRFKLRSRFKLTASPERQGWYAIMLARRATEDEIKFMEQIIRQSVSEVRSGIDEMMSGYLMATGERGLVLLEELKLSNPCASFDDIYPATQAVRFMLKNGEDRIPVARLQQSIRILLNRPDFASFAIYNLAAMKDWSVQDRLMELYGADEFDDPDIRQAIVRFTAVAAEKTRIMEDEEEIKVDDEDANGNGAVDEIPEIEPAEHVIKARKYLEELKERDPTTYQTAFRRWGVI